MPTWSLLNDHASGASGARASALRRATRRHSPLERHAARTGAVKRAKTAPDQAHIEGARRCRLRMQSTS